MMEITKQGFAVLSEDKFISKWAKEHGKIDHDDSALGQILPYMHGKVVIDGGAYISDHTSAYARVAKKVWAFESNPKAVECLEYNTKELSNVTVIARPLSFTGDKTKYATDYNIENVGASRLKEHELGIEAVSIDEMELKECGVIKLDIEGFELKALLGAQKTIKRFKPILIIEINEGTFASQGYQPGAVFEFLDQEGYSYRNIYQNEPMQGQQYDIICFPK